MACSTFCDAAAAAAAGVDVVVAVVAVFWHRVLRLQMSTLRRCACGIEKHDKIGNTQTAHQYLDAYIDFGPMPLQLDTTMRQFAAVALQLAAGRVQIATHATVQQLPVVQL